MKNKKTLIIILLVLCVGLVGLTIAYFSNSTTIDNLFSTKEYGTTYEEEFVSPPNWLPGDTTDKIVTVNNSEQVDEAVRISLSETWTPNNTNTTLTGWIHTDGTKSNHETEEELATDERAAVINFTENSDWTKVGDYYYYNYKLAPGETTDSLIESVTFNALTKLGDTCTPSTNNGTTKITCNSSGSDYDNATYKLTVNIETVQYNKYNEAWNLNNSVTIASMKPMNASQLALKSNPISVTNYTDGNVHEMYTFNHEATEQTPALTDYRYIGNDPYNYVYFNCDDLNNQNSDTCEVWRIIGVFDVERTDPNDNTQTITERRIKIVRGSAFADIMEWDNREGTESEDSIGINEWNDAKLEIFLNREYFDRNGSASNYGLKLVSKNMISNAKYYLGGADYYNGTGNGGGTPEAIYQWERGLSTFNYENYCRHNTWDDITCASDYCENNPTDKICTATRSSSWEGKVALIYLSDNYFVYSKGVEDTCYNNSNKCYAKKWKYNEELDIYEDVYQNPPVNVENNWIHNTNILEGKNSISLIWSLSPSSGQSNYVFTLSPEGGMGPSGLGYFSTGIRPVLYLSSNVKITDGDGSSTNPYKLGL